MPHAERPVVALRVRLGTSHSAAINLRRHLVRGLQNRARPDMLFRPDRQLHPLRHGTAERGHPESLDRHPDLQGPKRAAQLQAPVRDVRVRSISSSETSWASTAMTAAIGIGPNHSTVRVFFRREFHKPLIRRPRRPKSLTPQRPHLSCLPGSHPVVGLSPKPRPCRLHPRSVGLEATCWRRFVSGSFVGMVRPLRLMRRRFARPRCRARDDGTAQGRRPVACRARSRGSSRTPSTAGTPSRWRRRPSR